MRMRITTHSDNNSRLPILRVVTLLALITCSDFCVGQMESIDLSLPPQIHEITFPENTKQGVPIVVSARVTSDDGVREVVLHYRTTGTRTFVPLQMEAKPLDVYTATIPGNVVRSPGVEYYVHAIDNGNQQYPALRSMETPETDLDDAYALERLLTRVDIAETKERNWTWVALGVLGAAVAIALRDNGSDPSSSGTPSTTIDITGPVPR